MERVRRLYELPRYQEELKAIARAEVSREFCGHTLEHFLDVARLMYIRSLEEGEIVNREVIYAAALLHDLGRGMQYREGIPHQEAGVLLARELLPACRFDEGRSSLPLEVTAGSRRGRSRWPGICTRRTSRVETVLPVPPPTGATGRRKRKIMESSADGN